MRFTNFWTYRRILFSKGFLAALLQARRNIRDSARNRPLSAGPYLAELDITYRCNGRCLMCERWNDTRGHELQLEEYEHLARDLRAMGTHQISIAGGEPLLRPDVFDIVRSFSERTMSVNLCTNGVLLEHSIDPIIESGATCVTVSLDGASQATHDHIRGMPGSFHQIEAGLHRFLERPPGSRPIVRVRMTFSRENAHEIGAFCRKWEGVADDVLLQPVHYCSEALYNGPIDDALEFDPESVAEQISGTQLEGDGYLQQLIQSMRSRGTFPGQACFASILMARIDPWGTVYPCLEQHRSIGSLRDGGFRTIWHAPRAAEERQRLASERTCSCWFNNTALIGHYGELLSKGPAGLLRSLFGNGNGDRRE